LAATKPKWVAKVKSDMSKQYNKAEKRQRRNRYIKRQKTKTKAKRTAKTPATAA
jgi:hypothetical protein